MLIGATCGWAVGILSHRGIAPAEAIAVSMSGSQGSILETYGVGVDVQDEMETIKAIIR